MLQEFGNSIDTANNQSMSSNFLIDYSFNNLKHTFDFVQNKMREFSSSQNALERLDIAFDIANLNTAESYLEDWSNGILKDMPEIIFLKESVLQGAAGAYAKHQNKIYLSQSIISQDDLIRQTLIEEYGHALDQKINAGNDSQGDEGELFSKIVLGLAVGPEELTRLRNENDKGTLIFEDLKLEVEFNNMYLVETSRGDTIHTRGWETRLDSGYKLAFQQDGNLVIYNPSGQALWATGSYTMNPSKLVFQSDGNLVMYNSINQALWATNTFNNQGQKLAFQSDGNLVIYGSNGSALFNTETPNGRFTGVFDAAYRWQNPLPQKYEVLASSGTTTHSRGWETTVGSGYKLAFQQDGNLVIYSPSGQALWATGSYTMNPRKLVFQSDGNLVMYNSINQALWATNTFNNQGQKLTFQPDGNLVIYGSNGSALFNTETPNGRFTGVFDAAYRWQNPTKPNSQVFQLPYPDGVAYKVSAGNKGDNGSHHTSLYTQYAWDFAMPLGSTVVATKSGTVRSLYEGSNTQLNPVDYGWKTPSNWYQYTNYIVIDHGDGTSSLYAHLKYNSVIPKIGDFVNQNQKIAESGNTGFSSGPHLHYSLQKTPASSNYGNSSGGYWTESLSSSFTEVSGGIPRDENWYQS